MIQMVAIGEKGLAITFSKDDLIDIRSGKTLHGKWMGKDGEVKVMFMRDQVFKDLNARAARQAKAEAAAQQLANSDVSAEKLAEDIADESVNQGG